MSNRKNKHGLIRDIEASVQRQVRQECYFGCVVCGSIPYDYEHLDPQFAEAKSHDAAGLALLCPSHHRSKGPLVSRAAIRRARANPFNKNRDAAIPTVFGPDMKALVLGGNELRTPPPGTNIYAWAQVSLCGIPIIGLRPPNVPDGDWTLDGELRDDTGEKVMLFQGNLILLSTGAWDVEHVGGLITVRSGPRKITAQIRIDADRGTVTVERLHMGLGGGWRLDIDDELRLSDPYGNVQFGTRGIGFQTEGASIPTQGNGALSLNPGPGFSVRDFLRPRAGLI